jgi:hypothetical protein
MKTLSLPEAAAFLRCHPEWLRSQAKLGHIPGAKIGKSWVFIDEDLAAHIRAIYAKNRQMAQVEPQEVAPCHSTSAKIANIGGSKSRSRASRQCREVLGLKTE